MRGHARRKGSIHSLPTDCLQYNKSWGGGESGIFYHMNDVNVYLGTTNKRRVLPGLKTGLLSLMSVR